MLSRLPLLFNRQFVSTTDALDFALPVAQRQLRLVKWVFSGSLGLSALATLPQLSGPGPLLSGAASVWPGVFGALVELTKQPITLPELVGSAILVLALSVTCLAEIVALQRFLQDLEPVEAGSSVRDALDRLGRTTPAAAGYVRMVASVRELRLGDWRIAREIAEAGAERHG